MGKDETYPGLEKPEGLCPVGEKAYEVIRNYLIENNMDACGGGPVFYSPEQWRARAETYGRNSFLIITYDGADARQAFNMDYASEFGYRHHTAIREALDTIGVYPEECTGWFSAIYK